VVIVAGVHVKKQRNFYYLSLLQQIFGLFAAAKKLQDVSAWCKLKLHSLGPACAAKE